jgi:hypothetical protein
MRRILDPRWCSCSILVKVLLVLTLMDLPLLSEALNGPQIAYDLQSILSPGSGIYLPTDANWTTETTQRFNTWSAPTYVVSVKPALKEDVQKVVRCSSHSEPV